MEQLNLNLAQDVVSALKIKGLKLATAESCTGGLLSAAITSVPGSSNVFEYGLVTYSDQAKVELLGIDEALIEQHSVISMEVSLSMAQALITKGWGDIGVGITGVAGPEPSNNIDVGNVYIAIASLTEASSKLFHFLGTRREIQERAVEAALIMIFGKI